MENADGLSGRRRVEIVNNLIENAVRHRPGQEEPVVHGRHRCRGMEAILYAVIETYRRRGIDSQRLSQRRAEPPAHDDQPPNFLGRATSLGKEQLPVQRQIAS